MGAELRMLYCPQAEVGVNQGRGPYQWMGFRIPCDPVASWYEGSKLVLVINIGAVRVLESHGVCGQSFRQGGCWLGWLVGSRTPTWFNFRVTEYHIITRR